jgi:hypothetical protein
MDALWMKGQMLIPEWEALMRQILRWPILICKMPLACLILILLTLSSNNCIELYNLKLCVSQ